MTSTRTGKPNPECFPFAGMSISLKGPAGGEGEGEQIHLDEKDLHDAFQYALMPGGMPELREVSEFHLEVLVP